VAANVSVTFTTNIGADMNKPCSERPTTQPSPTVTYVISAPRTFMKHVPGWLALSEPRSSVESLLPTDNVRICSGALPAQRPFSL